MKDSHYPDLNYPDIPDGIPTTIKHHIVFPDWEDAQNVIYRIIDEHFGYHLKIQDSTILLSFISELSDGLLDLIPEKYLNSISRLLTPYELDLKYHLKINEIFNKYLHNRIDNNTLSCIKYDLESAENNYNNCNHISLRDWLKFQLTHELY